MPEATGNQEAKDYGIGIPQKAEGFFLKGASHLDWGMKIGRASCRERV